MRRLVERPLGSLGLALIALALLATACSASSKAPDQVHILTWDGDVNPVMVRYIDRGIDSAEKSDARAVVIKLDTPGGLTDSMRDVIQRIEASRVPVIVYVSPAGGQAASAGTFITMSAQIAAMAPNTTIGAATPINSNGEDIEGALGRKVTNDMVAYGRGIADLRERNADWAESAIRDATSANETQAVDQHVVDFVATSIDDLLQKSDGRQVQVALPNGDLTTVTVQTAGASTTEDNVNIFEQLLYYLADPNIAFLLLSLGGAALLIELWTPGFGVGIFGVLALVLAYFSLGSLPTNWAGAGLILLGIALLGAEIHAPGWGALGAGGIAALIIGGLILSGSGDTGYQVSRFLVIATGVVLGGLVLLFAAAVINFRRMPASQAPQLLGSAGVTRTELMPDGIVLVNGERWNATAEEGHLEEGAQVLVTRVEGLKVTVKRDPSSLKLLPPPPSPATSEG
jgi:membrane-bound serine protease (ClpP class)